MAAAADMIRTAGRRGNIVGPWRQAICNLQYIEFRGMIYGYSIGILSQFHEREKGNILQIQLDTKVGFYMYRFSEPTVYITYKFSCS
jgi:hypothetical protein